jgi:segregation and condensation protein B
MAKKKNTVEDVEATVDLTSSSPSLPLRDDAEDPDTESEEPHLADRDVPPSADPSTEPSVATAPTTDTDETAKKHLRGLVEALVFASDQPIKPNEIGKLAQAPSRQIKEVLEELKTEYVGRGIQLEEIAGGFAFRTNVVYAPFVRDLVGQKPVKLTRAQLETLAIVAYRQPITRPDIDDVRGVDCGPVLRTLLERDLVRILGKQEAAGRPLLYGTSAGFLELFGLKSLKDLPTLREFTELNEESKRTVERELGEELAEKQGGAMPELGDRPTMESVGVAHSQHPSILADEEPPPESKELESDHAGVEGEEKKPAADEEAAAADEEDDDDDDDDDDEDWDDDDDDWDDDDDDEDEEDEKEEKTE